MTIREFCIALLAGGAGVGGTVAVLPADRPAIERKVQAKSGPAIIRPAPARTPAPPAPIPDCPLPSVGRWAAGDGALFAPFDFPSAAGVHAPRPWIGGAGGAGPFPPVPAPPAFWPDALPPDVAPAVPEPAAWAMLVAGFGLIGLSARRSGRGVRIARDAD